jgi:hypothetical protein
MRRYIRILPVYWLISLYYLGSAVKRGTLFEMFFYYVLALNLLFSEKAVVPRSTSDTFHACFHRYRRDRSLDQKHVNAPRWQ